MDASLIFGKYVVQAHGRDVTPRSIVLGPFPQFRRACSSHLSTPLHSSPHHVSLETLLTNSIADLLSQVYTYCPRKGYSSIQGELCRPPDDRFPEREPLSCLGAAKDRWKTC